MKDKFQPMRGIVTTGNVQGVLNARVDCKNDFEVVTNAFVSSWQPGMPKSTLDFYRVAKG